jgi:DNA invertase Pin-like site-specific DNA recombinase
VIYGRQSRTKEKSESRESQVATCTEEAERYGVEVVAELIEPPSTGAFKNRGRDRLRWPELLELVRDGKVNTVIAYKTDRLSRGGGPGWSPLIEAAEAAGLDIDRFVLIVGSGFMSEFEIGIRASMDREESRKTSDRLLAVQERLATGGRFHGGRRPFGYAADGVTVDEDEAKLLKDAAKRILAGETLSSVCAEWNAAGVRTTMGSQWRAGVLRNTLGLPRLAGQRQHGVDDAGQPVIVGTAGWPAVLDRRTHERLRALLYNPDRPERVRRGGYLLTGIIHCGRCGRRMYGDPGSQGPAGPRIATYGCTWEEGAPSCGRMSVSARLTDQAVTRAVLEFVESPKFSATLRRRRRDDAEDAAKEAELLDAEARLLELAEEFGSGQIPRGQWLSMKKGAEARVEKARAAVAPIRKAAALGDIDPVGLRERWFATTPDDEHLMTIDQKRAVVAAVIESVNVAKGKRGSRDVEKRLTIVWRA